MKRPVDESIASSGSNGASRHRKAIIAAADRLVPLERPLNPHIGKLPDGGDRCHRQDHLASTTALHILSPFENRIRTVPQECFEHSKSVASSFEDDSPTMSDISQGQSTLADIGHKEWAAGDPDTESELCFNHQTQTINLLPSSDDTLEPIQNFNSSRGKRSSSIIDQGVTSEKNIDKQTDVNPEEYYRQYADSLEWFDDAEFDDHLLDVGLEEGNFSDLPVSIQAGLPNTTKPDTICNQRNNSEPWSFEAISDKSNVRNVNQHNTNDADMKPRPFLRRRDSEDSWDLKTSAIPLMNVNFRIVTCFRIAEAIRILNGQAGTPFMAIELYASVTEVRDDERGSLQHIQFGDTFFPQRPPYLHGLVDREVWLTEDKSVESVGRNLIIRAIIRPTQLVHHSKERLYLKKADTCLEIAETARNRSPQVKAVVHVESLRKSCWAEVQHVRGIVEPQL